MKVVPIVALELLDRPVVMSAEQLFELVGENCRCLLTGIWRPRLRQDEAYLLTRLLGSGDSQIAELGERIEQNTV